MYAYGQLSITWLVSKHGAPSIPRLIIIKPGRLLPTLEFKLHKAADSQGSEGWRRAPAMLILIQTISVWQLDDDYLFSWVSLGSLWYFGRLYLNVG